MSLPLGKLIARTHRLPAITIGLGIVADRGGLALHIGAMSWLLIVGWEQ